MNEIIDQFGDMEVKNKYILYIYLLEEIKKNEKQLAEHSKNVNSTEYVKKLLNSKKESAIVNLATILPFIKSRNVDAKNLILKILPVFFSYVTLYDTEVERIYEIIDTIRIHPAFQNDQELFGQWFCVFDKRRKSIKRKFTYKDEFYVQDLPSLNVNNDSAFFQYIGYSDIGLLRTVHRWLRILRLHKYLYFFANLSFHDILSIDADNISDYEAKVCVFDMTVGARNKILREIEELRNRPPTLKWILKEPLCNPVDLEEAIRIVKRIMRSPISLTHDPDNLPNLLTSSLKKVSFSLHEMVGKSEKVIPLYGLMISILKEAYNYNFFNAEQKEAFNVWRQQLSDKININSSKLVNRIPINRMEVKQNLDNIIEPNQMPIDMIEVKQESQEENDEGFSDYSLSPIEQNMAFIAIQVANFALS